MRTTLHIDDQILEKASRLTGELACGNIKNRDEILPLLEALPLAPSIDYDEFMFFVERNRLMGIGIGFVDVHLLASAQLAGVPLWTADKKLKSTAEQLHLAFDIHSW